MTVETNRMISEEITNQMSRKLNEIRESLNYQVQDAITSAITDKVLPSIQNTLSKQGRVNYTVVDRGSCGPHEGPTVTVGPSCGPQDPRSTKVATTVANYTTVDQRSSGLQRNPEVENGLKTREKRNKSWFSEGNDGQMSCHSSVDSITSEQNRDTRCYHVLKMLEVLNLENCQGKL